MDCGSELCFFIVGGWPLGTGRWILVIGWLGLVFGDWLFVIDR